jgi:hypothetical protein
MQGIDPSEFAALKAEVAALRASADPGPQPAAAPPARRRSRLHRAIAAAALTSLLVAMPVLVSASHQFSDVATSNTFHTSISNLYGARLTGGCASGKFCPNDNVTRGQMAAFLNRSLGRAASDSGIESWVELEDFVFGQVTLKTGGASGGTAWVWVTGNVSAWTDENGICPCEIELYLYNETTGEYTVSVYEAIGSEAPAGYYEDSATISHLFAVPSGVDITYTLAGGVISQLAPSPENEAAFSYDLTAMYLPFDWDGGNPDLPDIKTQGPQGRGG